MILSVSRRTDIPAFYGEWFLNRLKEGYVCVRNPFNFNMVSKIPLNSEVVDCIVFWTKDGSNFLKYLDYLDEMKYNYYFQYTITPYGNDIEERLRKKDDIIENFKQLSSKIGSNRVIWRYDPILITDNINIKWHIDKFEEMCSRLTAFTKTCIISFIDKYKKLDKNIFNTLSPLEISSIIKTFSKIAKKYNIALQSCAEEIDDQLDIIRGACIDKKLIEKTFHLELDVKKDKNQRPLCDCVESIDIGEYDSCPHLCRYCYANNKTKKMHNKIKNHNKNSPLLIGELSNTDKMYDRKVKSLKKGKNINISFFDNYVG